MRQPTLDEAARIIDAGDAMAEAMREMMVSHPLDARIDEDYIAPLVDAWRDATREVAP